MPERLRGRYSIPGRLAQQRMSGSGRSNGEAGVLSGETAPRPLERARMNHHVDAPSALADAGPTAASRHDAIPTDRRDNRHLPLSGSHWTQPRSKSRGRTNRAIRWYRVRWVIDVDFPAL